MGGNLKDTLVGYFSQKDTFDISDVFRFYVRQEPEISRTTVNWRIHALVQKGVIQRVGRGFYRLGKTNQFQHDLSPQIRKMARSIKKKFPYTNFCVWELAVVNHFGHNLINSNTLFVDVERDATDAFYYKLKEKNRHVVSIQKTYDDISELSGCVCIRPLVSCAPIRETDQIPVASLEKILVDLATDKVFFPFQGNEIFSIYHTAFEKYTINKSSMLRYAARKEKRAAIQEIINSINRQ